MEIRFLICFVSIICLFSCEKTENTVHIDSIKIDYYHVDSILNKKIYASNLRNSKDTSLVMIDFKLNAIPISKGTNIMSPIMGMDGKTDSILRIQVLDSKGRDIRNLLHSSENNSFRMIGYRKNKYQNTKNDDQEDVFPIVPFNEVTDIMKLYNNSRNFKLNDTLMLNNSFVFLMKDSLIESLQPITFSLDMFDKKTNRRYQIKSSLKR